MNLHPTSENLTRPFEQSTEAGIEDQPLHPNQKETKLSESLLSLRGKLNELARVNHRLFKIIDPSRKGELDVYDLSSDKSLFQAASQDVLTEPELNYRLSWLLDFLRHSYGFEDGGVFLLDDKKGGIKKLILSSEPLEEFEDEVKALWRRGGIVRAVNQKRRMILPAKNGGNFLVIPFKILDRKDGFWVAHFQQKTIAKEKKSVDLLFWVELFATCIENSYLKDFSSSPQKEKSYHIETEKLFTTGELSKAVVHEINNSLQIILGRTQLLKMNEKKSTKRSSAVCILETIEDSADQICANLKDFSDHLHRQLDRATDAGEVNIQHILKSNIALLEYILKSNSIKLEVNLDDHLPAVYGNPGELELALLSVIWEIQDHLSSEGTIRLQTTTEEKSLYLDIYCTGEEIYEPGYQEFTDLTMNDRIMMVSQILGSNQGELKFEKALDNEMKFSLKFSIASETERNQKALNELRL
ncbi:MAG: hypothetical protein AMJ91_00750 [candidate division Zixibacteria bacterium SM23_73_3]|nr:MAG: hypothetical protein AMJ91_00750 [candidate division Zixibacteria bacterium SM23_73_3]